MGQSRSNGATRAVVQVSLLYFGRERAAGSCHEDPRRPNGGSAIAPDIVGRAGENRRVESSSVTPQIKYVNLKMTVIARGPQGDGAAVSIKPGNIQIAQYNIYNMY